MRLTTNPLGADAEPWDPANPGPFKALTGGQFVGQEGEVAQVRTQGGCVMHVHPGWLAFRIDGEEDGKAHFTVPENVGDGTCLWSAAAGG